MRSGAVQGFSNVLIKMGCNDSALLTLSLSTPMGVDYVAIGFEMEVQPLVTHNAA